MVSIGFEWEDNADDWKSYSSTDSETIATSFDKGKRSAKLVLPTKAKAEIFFDKMIQKNSTTGYERRIRCVLADKSKWFYWEWANDNNSYSPYSIKHSLSLEEAYQNDSTAVFHINTVYDIDFSSMQQINKNTQYKRTIRRVQTKNKHVKTSNKSTKRKTSPEVLDAKPVSRSAKVRKSEKSTDEPSTSSQDTSAGDTMKKMSFTGAVPVDEECVSKVAIAHVLCEGSTVWDAMLNQTNVAQNNNKYYKMQLLKDNKSNIYSVWFRWGRVGYKGQNTIVPCAGNLDSAKDTFCKKFLAKTGNEWSDRSNFVKHSGKYDLVHMDYGEEKEPKPATKKIKKEPTVKLESELHEKIYDLIESICNVNLMENTAKEMQYDVTKAPLGKLTSKQIKAGYKALKAIAECVKKNTKGSQLNQACSEFYTRIPHYFGMKQPPLITTVNEVKEKIKLLEALEEIEIAMKVLEGESQSNIHPIDQHYKALNCNICPIDHTSEIFKIIKDGLQNTHASTHNLYKMKVSEIFALNKNSEASQFLDYGNKMLLWHGTRMSNLFGILSHGLKIAPLEAPVTGYMFGKGVYFADVSSKSANYCYPSPTNETGFLLLCEVSLGATNPLIAADYDAAQLPNGCKSVHGLGKTEPDGSGNVTILDGVKFATGKLSDTGVSNPSGYTLNYNEFVIYDTRQIRMRYLIKVKFEFEEM